MGKKVLTILALVTTMCIGMSFVTSAVVTLDEYVTKSEVNAYIESVQAVLATEQSRIMEEVAKNKRAKAIHDMAESSTTSGGD